MTGKKMTAAVALSILQQAVFAADYLENSAQEGVNADGAVVALAVAAKEDVDGREIAGSWKDKVNATKYGRQTAKMIKLAEAFVAVEAKSLAITTTATPKAAELGMVKAS